MPAQILMMENFKKLKPNTDRKKILNTIKKLDNFRATVGIASLNSSRPSPWGSPELLSERSLNDHQIAQDHSIESQNTTKKPENSKCPHCITIDSSFKQMESTLKEKIRNINIFNQKLMEENVKIKEQLRKVNDEISSLGRCLEPYQNNVVLMEQTLNSIKEYLEAPDEIKKIDLNGKDFEEAFTQRKKSMDIEVDFLRKTHLRDQQENESKLTRLNLLISRMEKKNNELQKSVTQLKNKNAIYEAIINDSAYVIQQRELFMMACEELYQLKIEKARMKSENEGMKRNIERLKNKIHMLTSLIGYGVVSNIENNELHQIDLFKQNLDKISGLQNKLSWDIEGVTDLKVCEGVEKHRSHSEEECNLVLYKPNFIIFFEQAHIRCALEENTTTIIKSEFFLLTRAIMDSKYQEFLLSEEHSTSFSDFVYGFIQMFRIRPIEKRVQLNSKRGYEHHDIIKTTFLLRIFDHKIGQLPEIVTFKEFMLKNTPKDEVFYFLMCRDFIHNGPEMANYISCGDSYNFVPYERVRKVIVLLMENYDNNTKTLLFNHLNQKKVLKNKTLLIKSGYVLRILLETYRKSKKEKIGRLKAVFEQTCKMCQSSHPSFYYFHEIIMRNFDFLTYAQISEFYRQSVGLYQTHTNISFFNCFNSSCLEVIFLKEALHKQTIIHSKCNAGKENRECNYLIKLIPDSISQLGNEDMYQKYIELIKMKSLGLHERVAVGLLLLKTSRSRLWAAEKGSEEAIQIEGILDTFNNQLIEWINRDFQKRQKYEAKLCEASSLLGWHFKRKIYEFYSDFIKDINTQIEETV